MTTSREQLRFLHILANTTLVFILACCANVAMADTLGRLYFTPEQRAQLDFDNARDGTSSPVLTVNGIVQKQGGARTVWINGVAESGNNTERNPTAQTVAIPGKTKKIKLKVGDKILLDQPNQSSQETK